MPRDPKVNRWTAVAYLPDLGSSVWCGHAHRDRRNVARCLARLQTRADLRGAIVVAAGVWIPGEDER